MIPEEMSIDDRLRSLVTATASTLASCKELSAQMARQAEESKRETEKQAKQFNRHRRAILAAIRAYLENDLEEGV